MGFSLVDTRQGVFAMGGYDRIVNRNEILKLACPDDNQIENCQWQETEQKLEKESAWHVSIPLP